MIIYYISLFLRNFTLHFFILAFCGFRECIFRVNIHSTQDVQKRVAKRNRSFTLFLSSSSSFRHRFIATGVILHEGHHLPASFHAALSSVRVSPLEASSLRLRGTHILYAYTYTYRQSHIHGTTTKPILNNIAD